MKIFPAYECEIPILSSYTECKEKSPLITAQIYKSFSEHLYSDHYKAIMLTLLCSSYTFNQQLWEQVLLFKRL